MQSGDTLPIILTAVDPDGTPLTWSIVTPPTGQLTGALTGAAPALTYTAPNALLTDVFVYRVSDGALTADATITIDVTRPNVPPVAADDVATTTQETPVVVDVLAGDTDADGDVLTVIGYTSAAHGSVGCSSVDCTYTPEPGYFGPDSFGYWIDDGFGGQALGTVTVTVEQGPISATLAPATATTGPGATSIALADIPYERMRELDVDVSNAPFVRAGTVDAAGTVHASGHRGCERAPFDEFAPFQASRSARRRAHRSRRSPSTSRVGGPRCWPALHSAVNRPRASPSASSWRCTTRPDRPRQTLRDLTLEDVSFFDGTPFANASPAAFLLGGTPVVDLRYGTETWCERLAADTEGASTCTSLGVDSSDDALGARRRHDSGGSARTAPRPAARPIGIEHGRVRRCAGARRPLERAQPVRDRYRSDHGDLGDRCRPRPSGRSASLTSRSTTRIPTTAPTAAATWWSTVRAVSTAPVAPHSVRPEQRAPCSPAPVSRTSDAPSPTTPSPGIRRSLSRRSPAALPPTLDLNDVIVGTLDQSDFPWEDVDLTTSGLQDFARTGSTLDWNVLLSISSARGGPGPFATTITVSLPPGFRYFTPTPARPAPAALNSFTPAAGTVSGPVATDGPSGQVLVWTVADVLPDTDYTLTFRTTPGLELGQAQATAKIEIVNGTATVTGDVGVIDTNDASGVAASALPVVSNVLYLGYVDKPNDLDLYGFDATPLAQVGVRLSHLAGDGDLVVYGPATDRPGNSPSPVATRTATPSTPPLQADALDVSGAGYSPEPDTDAGVPLIDGLTVVGRSAARNTDLEAVDAIEPDLLQVSSYNTSVSNLPYVLRVRQVDPPNTPTCTAYGRTGGVAGTLPDLTALPADLATIFLVNRERLGDTFGPTAANDVISALETLAARPDVKGVVVPVEGDASVASAYAAWNANPCASDRANKVVSAITRLVMGVRNGALPGVAAHPSLENVVLVGGDDIVPMARLDDTTRVGNETGYADEFDVNGPYYGALETSHFFSDDPYGDLDPIEWATRRLYVPELALGRLVESPTQIIAQIDAFGGASGRLDASRAYAAGYDFMTDGASSVRDALSSSLTSANGAPAVVSGPVNDSTWSGAELLGDLTGPPAPSVSGLFAHFDHTALQTPDGDALTAAQLAATLPTGARLVFSMGCHSGLAVSDITVGGGDSADDVAAALTARGAVYLSTTGYGYGDQVSVGLHERLMVLFAGELDGSVSVGDAVRNAKQTYFAGQGLYGAYDEKALSSTILYGLPMFAVGTERPVRPIPPNAAPAPVAGTSGLSSLAYDETFTFASRTGDIGRWYEADAGSGPQLPQITAGRPVQPRSEIDVTAAAPDNSLLPAHGAVVTDLRTGQTVTDFDAAFSRPTLDSAAGEPEAVNSVAAFPTRLAGVTMASNAQGLIGPDGIAQRQQLVLIPGQFVSAPTAAGPDVGTQLLYDRMAGDVYYSTSNDWDAPQVGEVVLVRTPGSTSADLSVSATDASGIHRVVGLYQAGGDWQTLELAESAGTFGGTLTVPAAIANEQIKVVVQAVDGAGNVAWAANKGPGFSPLPPPPPPPVVTLNPAPAASGWSTAAPQVSVTGGTGTTFTVSVDRQPPEPYTGPFVPTGLADGQHVIEVFGSNGGTATLTLRIDHTPPTIVATVTPAANAAGWHNSTATAAFTCGDTVSGIASCPQPTTTGFDEGSALVLSGTATDLAGLTASTSSTVKVDRTAPAAPTVTVDPSTRSVGDSSAITATSSDALSGLAGGEWWVGSDPGVGNGNQLTLAAGSLTGTIPSGLTAGSYDVSVRAVDAAGNWGPVTIAPLAVTSPGGNTPPTATPQTLDTPEDTPLTITLTGTDPDTGDTLTYTVTTQPTHGTLTGTGTTREYTPDTNYHGPDSFRFTVDDGSGPTTPAAISITVTPVNDPPIAEPVTASTPRDTAVLVTLSASDIDGDPLTYTVVDQPAHGTLTGTGTTRTYTPDTGYTGADTFTYLANDGNVDSNTSTVTITIEATNRPPTATPQTLDTPEDTPLTITLTGTDPDTGDTLTYTVTTQPTHGTLTGTGTTREYTPDTNYHGPDSFRFTVDDGSGPTTPAAISITVTPVNDPPIAEPVTASTPRDTAVLVTLSASDIDGDPLTYTIVDQPAHGTLTGTGTTRTYTPDTGYTGADTFTYLANDGNVDSNTSTVTITIEATNRPPTATPQTLDTPEDTPLTITLTGTDPDTGDTLTYTVTTQPTHGTLTGTGTTREYTPDTNYHGPDSFRFTVDDGSGPTTPAAISITVTPVNDPPIAEPVTASSPSGVPVSITLSATDVDGDPLTYTIVTPPAHGTLTGAGTAYSYSSDPGYVGSDGFTYAADDGQVSSNPVTVSIEVTPASPATVTLSLADNAARSRNVRPLDGDILKWGRSAYIFLGGDGIGDVQAVTFTLDGSEFSTEAYAPYDFAGTAPAGRCRRCPPRAYPFESNLLTLGEHVITATVVMGDGSQQIVAASFGVANTTPHDLMVSSSSRRRSAERLDGNTLTGRRYVFLGNVRDSIAGLRYVTFYLDGAFMSRETRTPYDAAGTQWNGTAAPVDTRTLANGSHTITAVVELLGGAAVTYTSTFQVFN